MSIEVLNESGVDVDVAELSRLVAVRAGPDARPPAGRAVRPARRRGDHGRAPRAVDGRSRARPTCWPSRWTSCGPAWSTRSPRRACSATSCSARRSPRGRPRRPGTPTPDELDLLTRARHPAPARLRPRRARGARGDVRAAGARCSTEWRATACETRMSVVDVWLLVRRGAAGRARGRPVRSADAALSSFSKARAEELAARGQVRVGAAAGDRRGPAALPQHRAVPADADRDRRDRPRHRGDARPARDRRRLESGPRPTAAAGGRCSSRSRSWSSSRSW